jgi:hypothetical protein
MKRAGVSSRFLVERRVAAHGPSAATGIAGDWVPHYGVGRAKRELRDGTPQRTERNRLRRGP